MSCYFVLFVAGPRVQNLEGSQRDCRPNEATMTYIGFFVGNLGEGRAYEAQYPKSSAPNEMTICDVQR
jgi:hypothetical protein